MALGSHVGRTWPDRVIAVEEGALRFFAKATGETDPVYTDPEAARAAGHPGLPAPPTFVFSLEIMAPAETFWLDDLGVELSKVLHAEQAFEHHRTLHAGDVITLRSRISDAYEKKGGLLEFMVREIEATDATGVLCATMKTTLVVRHG